MYGLIVKQWITLNITQGYLFPNNPNRINWYSLILIKVYILKSSEVSECYLIVTLACVICIRNTVSVPVSFTYITDSRA